MSLTINTDLASMDAQRHQAQTQSALATSLARLSSGLRINGAADDAAGLAIAERFTAQLRGLDQGGRNTNDGISLAQTAEGALASIDGNLQRMRELAVQAANATASSADRASLQQEVAQLQGEIDRVARQTAFNGSRLLDGNLGTQAFQVGGKAGQTIEVDALPDARAGSLGLYRGFMQTQVGLGVPTNVPLPYTVSVGGGPEVPLGSLNCEAKAFADAYNAAHIPGLTASANATVVSGTSSAAASAAGTATLTVNGVVVSLAGAAGTAALAGNRANAVAALNARSAATGVVATDTGSGVQLTAADGRNVELIYSAGSFSGSGAADFGVSTTTLSGGTYNLSYVQPAGISGDVVNIQHPAPGIQSPITFTVGTAGTAVGALDIVSVPGANQALTSLDRALDTIASARASLGAVQNRFATALQNIGSSSINVASSRSRIRDADFAVESAAYSRAQVLQQAGTAMIAQANQMPAQVLSLLR